ncbi:Cadherin-related family member 4 [Gossypium australe]|uniref:Cadherin-related family member 4 n=1 Tax=Gossypium australe TaxID=47621 RepID=A0A5B6V950_9ROSI|nr:Cadherin-related family member 4 [Gossypium australe]
MDSSTNQGTKGVGHVVPTPKFKKRSVLAVRDWPPGCGSASEQDRRQIVVVSISDSVEIAGMVSGTLNVNPEIASRKMTVLSPLGQSIVVDKLFREVPLEVQGSVFPADLMEIPFGEFDLILGMDWLVRYRANLDCATKRMTLKTSEDDEVLVIGERRDYLADVVSALKAEEW